MTPALDIRIGDVRDRLMEMPDESVHCVVTSPPYWGLRDYGTAQWEGGIPGCDHLRKSGGTASSTLGSAAGGNPMSEEARVRSITRAFVPYSSVCEKCGAVRIDSQIGLEATPEEYVANLVSIFREVRRVLRKDGTLWLNMGDTYAANRSYQVPDTKRGDVGNNAGSRVPLGLKAKDLVGIPWRLALALQADGWWLRADIIWAKKNPMPSSTRDRPTTAHEYVFLLSKSPRYFYDHEAVAEPVAAATVERMKHGSRYSDPCEAAKVPYAIAAPKVAIPRNPRPGIDVNGGNQGSGGIPVSGGKRNLRSVWTLSAEPYKGAHFATYPTKLVEPCIKAGTSERGCCYECGAPWRREIVRVPSGLTYKKADGWATHEGGHGSIHRDGREAGERGQAAMAAVTTGWAPTCKHEGEPVPCIVLDPFLGSGTTAVVAARLGRNTIGIELSPEYAEMARERFAKWWEKPKPKQSKPRPAQLTIEGA